MRDRATTTLRLLDRLTGRLAILATRLPRGGYRLCRLLRALRPNLATYPVATRYGLLVCDIGEPVCQPLLRLGEYPHWRIDEEGLARIPLGPESIVLDVGANIGVLTRIFAARAGHVHAFEPAPRALRLLRANVAGLANVTVHAVAVGNRVGTTAFVEREALDMSSIDDAGGGLQVPITTIDALGIVADFIKIDVEGFEEDVLRGASATISGAPIIVFEALSDQARAKCEEIILAANPAYEFERLGGGSNFIAWPKSAQFRAN